jgi:hypothetical protein
VGVGKVVCDVVARTVDSYGIRMIKMSIKSETIMRSHAQNKLGGFIMKPKVFEVLCKIDCNTEQDGSIRREWLARDRFYVFLRLGLFNNTQLQIPSFQHASKHVLARRRSALPSGDT